MILTLLLLACSEYDVISTQDYNNGANDSTVSDTSDPIITEEIATEEIYVNTGSELYSLNPTTLSLTFVGEFKSGQQKIENMTDIAVNSSGKMFGTTQDSLYQIIPTTADTLFIRTLDKEYMGLTALDDNTLVAAGSSLDIISIYGNDTNTIIPSGTFETSGDIVALPDGLLYWSIKGEKGDQIVAVDRYGSIDHWGTLDTEGLYGLGYANDELFGFTKDNSVVVINPDEIVVKDEYELQGSWWGAATNPLLWE